MSLEAAFAAPVVLTKPDGSQVSFPILDVDEIAELSAVIESAREAANSKRARLAGLAGADLAHYRFNSERFGIDIDQLYQMSGEAKWAKVFLLKSIGDTAENQKLIKSLPLSILTGAALRVLGWVPPPPKSEDKQPENPPVQDAGLTGSGTAG